ncbi:hypothetical protein CJ030_MR3G008395 [Morella rubra]|uniref:Uncharacterized protein n=1 Tax=Morella rubra TaxID=262757 RepID=A0A6A1W1L3_9ROSI|nr:hypothetical protein CJ030_MR3G008399 [Morella rubra]KAB1219138.1 hypothetical protein CJ030_MR3G008395 [Morella rubra]
MSHSCSNLRKFQKGTPHNGETGAFETVGTSGIAGTSQTAGDRTPQLARTTTRKRRGTQANVQESSQPPTLPRRSPRKKSSTTPVVRATQ